MSADRVRRSLVPTRGRNASLNPFKNWDLQKGQSHAQLEEGGTASKVADEVVDAYNDGSVSGEGAGGRTGNEGIPEGKSDEDEALVFEAEAASLEAKQQLEPTFGSNGEDTDMKVGKEGRGGALLGSIMAGDSGGLNPVDNAL